MGVSYSDAEVTIRGFARTRKWHWATIKQFSVAIHPVGAMSYRRKVLTVTLMDGKTIRLKEQNASPKQSQEPSWVEEAAAALNRELIRPLTDLMVPQYGTVGTFTVAFELLFPRPTADAIVWILQHQDTRTARTRWPPQSASQTQSHSRYDTGTDIA